MKHSPNLIVFCLLLLCLPVKAQKFQYVTYKGEGVPFTQVNQVVQDHMQYLWVASDQGLYRFNGTNFEDFNTSLKSRYIRSIVSPNDSTILFSNDTGVHRLDYTSPEYKISPLVNFGEDNPDMGYPGQIFSDSKNRLWIAGLDGRVFLRQSKEGLPEAYVLANGSKTDKMYFGEDAFSTIWVLVPSLGLFYFDAHSDRFEEVKTPFSVSHFLIEENRMLLAGNGLAEWTIGAGGSVNPGGFNLPDLPHAEYIARDKSGILYLATETGLFSLIAGEQPQLQPVYGSNDPHRVEELPINRVNQLYFSTDQRATGGMLWVAMPDGLALLFSSYFKSVSGMSHDNVFALGNGFDGEVLISMGKVFRISSENIQPEFAEMSGSNRVTSISSANEVLWMGSAEGQLYRYTRTNQRSTTDLSNRGGGIFYMYSDHAGDLWFCQAPTEKPIIGIAKASRDGNLTFYDSDKGLGSRILVVAEGGKNELYAAGIGMETYLYKYDRSADTFVNHSQPMPFTVSRNFEVHDLAVDDMGMVWMGTTDGLLKFDTEKVYRIDLGRYTEQEIRAVCTLPDGSVWLATDTSGLIHLDASGKYVLFDEKSGTPSKIASYRSLLLDTDYRLWAGTAEGAVFSSSTRPGPLESATPRLQNVYINNQQATRAGSLQFAGEDLVEIVMVAVAYPTEGIRYRYKYFSNSLSDADIADIPWSETSQEMRLQLKGLEGGRYQLWCEAQQAGGHGWSMPAIIPFSILKPWYARWWGISLLLLGGLFIVWYGVRSWTGRKVSKLEHSLSDKDKELSKREAQLKSQTDTIKQQKEALKNAGVTIYLLRRLIRQLPRDADWDTLLPLLAKLVELPTGLDAFELVILEKDKIKIHSFRRGAKGNPALGEKELDEKSNLPSYTLCNHKPLLLKDYFKEVEDYIAEADELGFGSRIYIPFEVRSGQEVVFCAYATKPNSLEQRDMTMLQILVAFLERSVTTAKTT